MQRLKNDEYVVGLYNLYAGGLIVISLIMLQDFIALGKLDLPAFISVLAFSVALPLLSGMLVLNAVGSRYRYGSPHQMIARVVYVAFIVGILMALIGIATAFWHMSWILGVSFLSALAFALIIYSMYAKDLKEDPDPR